MVPIFFNKGNRKREDHLNFSKSVTEGILIVGWYLIARVKDVKGYWLR